MKWRRDAGGWRVVEWTAASHVASRAAAPVFTEVTAAALGGNDSFRRQLERAARRLERQLDSVLTRDSNGHHGVSVGDADGDGLEDLYVAQPAGLPNRLYRARGDGTFEDATEARGARPSSTTPPSRSSPTWTTTATRTSCSRRERSPCSSSTTARAASRTSPDAFRFARPLQGSLTSIAMADYDRDGFLDLYLCVYSYFYGAGEDKAGTPAPYYDARNGPPGVLFRNDGHGRFVDATSEAGLDAGNDRYHFAAAWADYDGDGWQDLLVANDFGTKNLYRNRGRRDGKVTFEDVAAEAGVLDHGAGMSAAFLDYDNDGRLDIYTGNMWSDNGLRVTSSAAFMPEAPPEVKSALPPPRAGQLALPEPGRRPLRGREPRGSRRDGPLGVVVRRARLRQRRLRGPLRRERHADAGVGTRGPRRLLLAAGRGPLAAHPRHRDALRRRLARHQPAADQELDRRRQRNVLLRNDGRAASTTSRARPGSTSTRTGARSPCSTSTGTATPTSP